jgi:hypothetical protein
MKLKILLAGSLLLFALNCHAQVIIVAIFGDDLNSGKIEFGLDGGYNASWMIGQPDAEALHNFNLGFFFHIKLLENSYISTGVHVKSNVGASGMPTYPIGDAAFDSVFAAGERATKLSVFYVPILWQQRFNKFYIEGGIQPGLRTTVNDVFTIEDNDGDLEYKRNVKENYTKLDFGLTAGFGYRFKPGPVSTSIGTNYYYGLVDVYKPADLSVSNSTLYLYARIPIGAGEKAQAKKEAKKKKNE